LDAREDFETELCRLLEKAAAGNRSAFSALYKMTAPKFYAITMKMVRSPQITDDILQRAYLSIWKNAGRFDPHKGKAFTWMLVIMRNRTIDSIRAQKHHATIGDFEDCIEDEAVRTDEGARGFLLRRLIRPHLNGLPAHTAQAIILNTVHGLSSREIGERMGVPTHTAKSRIRRGLERLRNEMDSETLTALL